tara:strand:- start:86 stop:703 length:618 start_codon:yes stop_codon:yes gene_type:complete
MSLPICIRRINREIKNFHDEKYNNTYFNNYKKYFETLDIRLIFCDDDTIKHYLEIIDKTTKQILLRLIIPNEYPFKPYKVLSYHLCGNSDKNYSKYISELNSKNKIYNNEVLNFFYKIQYNKPKFLNFDYNTCYCCVSYSCPSVWHPGLTLNFMLIEYLEMTFINKYSKPYNYLILENTYNYLFENYFNKLPNEIIEMIFNYMHN